MCAKIGNVDGVTISIDSQLRIDAACVETVSKMVKVWMFYPAIGFANSATLTTLPATELVSSVDYRRKAKERRRMLQIVQVQVQLKVQAPQKRTPLLGKTSIEVNSGPCSIVLL